MEDLKKEVEETKLTEANLTSEQVGELESLIKEQFEYDKKWPHRHKKYNRLFNSQQVKCAKCEKTHTLTLTTEKNESSFKSVGHKKNRNDIPVLDDEGNKIYFCKECIKEEATRLRREGIA